MISIMVDHGTSIDWHNQNSADGSDFHMPSVRTSADPVNKSPVSIASKLFRGER